MPTTVSLRNRTKRLLVLNLPHGVVPEHASMGIVGVQHHDVTPVSGPNDASAPNAGARKLVAYRKPISGSITLLPKGHEGDTAEDLPRSVLQAPDVISARQRGDVELVEAAPAADAGSTAPATKPTPKQSPASSPAVANTKPE